MKTIEEKSFEYKENVDLSNICDTKDVRFEIQDAFTAGAEFAQRWIQIDRCTNGYITAHSLSDIERNLPVIMNDEDGDKDDEYIIIKYISDLLDMDESFTHWRPVNLK